MKNKPYPYYEVPMLDDLKELVDYCAEKYADKVAFHWLEKKVENSKTYKQFKEDVEALAAYFVSKGYNRTHIAVIGENCYEWLVSFFAIVNSDNVVVPLDKELNIEDINKIITRSDSAVLIHSDDFSEEAESTKGVELINMKNYSAIISEYKNTDNSTYENIKIDNEKMCAIFYTSGTTAEPKGVMLSHKNIIQDALYSAMNAHIPQTSILLLPLHHAYAITIAINLPMIYGTSVFINKSLRNLMSDILYCKPGYIALVPLMLEIFYKKITDSLEKQNKLKLVNRLTYFSKYLNLFALDIRRKIFSEIIDSFGGNLALIAVGGAPLKGEIINTFISFGINVLGGYGTSECSPIVSFVRDKHYNPYSSGTILPNVETRIVNGELQVRGDIVFKGYYKDVTATKAVFEDGWYKTGDLAHMEGDFLFITGRVNNLIVLSNGENVSPESVENFLYDKIPEIEEIVVYSVGDTIVAEIYIPDFDSVLEEKIRRDIDVVNKELPVYKQISKIKFRQKEFEKTTTKKIKRKER